MRKLFCLLVGFVVAGVSPVFAGTEEEGANLQEIITRARATVGSEATLDAVKTLSFEAEVSDEKGAPFAKISLRYKKPYFCREIVRRTMTQESSDDFYYPEEKVERPAPKTFDVEIITISDGYVGVRIVRNLTENTRNISYLSPQDVLLRRDLVDANLGFYRSLDATRGKTTFAGTQTLADGKKQNKVRYEYSGGLTLVRAFDDATGALVSTQNGEELAFETGEKLVTGGLTFLDGSKNCDLDGNAKNSFHFTKILVNEDIPDAEFRLSVQELTGE